MPAITKTYKGGDTSIYWGHSEDIYQPFRIVQPNLYGLTVTLPLDSTKTGINVPGYKSLIANERSATSTFSGTKRTMKSTDWAVDTTWRVNLTGSIFGPRKFVTKGIGVAPWATQSADQLDPPGAAAENTALIKLYKRIRKEHQSFSGLTFLGELRESVRMIRRPALALRQGANSYLQTLKKRSRGIPMSQSGRRTRKRILAETWLEFSFGWTPLLMDIKGAAETLERFRDERDGFITRRSRVSGKGESQAATVTTAYKIILPQTDNFTNVSWLRRTVATKTVRYLVGLSYKTAVPSGSAKRLAQLSGFTLAEFVPTAWELIPWSFLVDYFSNVGDVLEAFTTPTENIWFINKTVRTRSETEFRSRLDLPFMSTNPAFLDFSEGDTGAGGYLASITVINRTPVPLNSLGYPRFKLENPFGSNGIRRSLNMASLAASSRSLKPFY